MIIAKSYRFEASHVLPLHPGKCSRLHGHSYEFEVMLDGSIDPETNFVLDYALLDEIAKPIAEKLDHQHLNFHIVYPSAENIATYIAAEVTVSVPPGTIAAHLQLAVTVKETAKTWAMWRSIDPRDVEHLTQSRLWRTPPTGAYESIMAELVSGAMRCAPGRPAVTLAFGS